MSTKITYLYSRTVDFYRIKKNVIEGETEGRVEVTGRRGRRCKQLLDDLKRKRGHWKLKQEVPDRALCRLCFGEEAVDLS
jgi:hypothetical protein